MGEIALRKYEEVDPKLIEANSAFQDHMGYRLTHWGEGYARMDQPLEPYLMNRMGIPHGGNYGVILDTTMGFSGVYTGDPDRRVFAVTLSINVNFVAVASGKKLIVEAESSGEGKRTFFAEGRVFDDSGHLVARGSGVFQRREVVL